MAITTLLPLAARTGSGSGSSFTGFGKSTSLRAQFHLTGPPAGAMYAVLEDTLDDMNWNEIARIGEVQPQSGPRHQMTNIVTGIIPFNPDFPPQAINPPATGFGPTLRVSWNIPPSQTATFSVIISDK